MIFLKPVSHISATNSRDLPFMSKIFLDFPFSFVSIQNNKTVGFRDSFVVGHYSVSFFLQLQLFGILLAHHFFTRFRF